MPFSAACRNQAENTDNQMIYLRVNILFTTTYGYELKYRMRQEINKMPESQSSIRNMYKSVYYPYYFIINNVFLK